MRKKGIEKRKKKLIKEEKGRLCTQVCSVTTIGHLFSLVFSQ